MSTLLMAPDIQTEFAQRIAWWGQICREDSADVAPQHLRSLGVYKGGQGIWVDKKRTADLSSDGYGVTVSILHTGRHYPDDLSSDGLIYHYPSTRRGRKDQSEIQATKNTKTAGLPLFTILPGLKSKAKRCVKLAWVEDWDDEGRLFLISFDDEPPVLTTPVESGEAFKLEGDTEGGVVEAKTRPNQRRFRFRVLQRYGHKCAVCSISLPQLLIAAHIRGKREQGSDDWRNGLPLCGTHHTAFDLHLFSIEPGSLNIIPAPGVDIENIGIEVKSLMTKRERPHEDALIWRSRAAMRAWK